MGRTCHRHEPSRAPAALIVAALIVATPFTAVPGLCAPALAQAGDPPAPPASSPVSGADRAVAEARRRYLGDLLDVKSEVVAAHDRRGMAAEPGERNPIDGLSSGRGPMGPAVIWEVRLLVPDAKSPGAQVIRVRFDDAGRFLEATGHDLAAAARRPPP